MRMQQRRRKVMTHYEELEQVFDHFPKYHMKILLRDFNAKLGREAIFKPTIGKPRGRCCNIIILNVHASTEEKSDVSQDSFYEEL
jgi:hypothetical protein